MSLETQLEQVATDINTIKSNVSAVYAAGIAAGGDTGVGEKYLVNDVNAGEIFNDYENNKAVSEYSRASGSNTCAGHFAFSFKEHEYTEADYDTTNNIGKYYLNTVEGITVGLNYTIVLNNNFGYQGVVNSVGEDYIEVTNYLVPNSDSTKTIYYDSSYIIFPDKPAIQGDMLIGYAANSEGYNTNAMGKSSHAEGGSTIASGQYSHAEGRGSKAGGYASHAETSGQALGHGSHAESLSIAKGEYSHGEGRSSAIGNQSHAEGQNTVAEGANSHTEGYNTYAQGYASHTEGKGTYANSEASHAEGSGTKAQGYASHAEGNGTSALGENAHAEGSGTVAEGIISHAEGKDTRAIGNQSHVEGTGSNTTINGQHGHAEGYCSSVDALGAHAEGYRTVASGKYAHAEGSGTKAQGYASHVEGYNTSALGENAHAEGSYTNATSSTSHAEGQSCLAAGKASHAEGLFAKAHGEAQHVQGRYNIEDTENKYAHIVGNGALVTGEDGKEIRALSNAHTLDWEGNAWFAGDVVAGDVSLQSLMPTVITSSESTIVYNFSNRKNKVSQEDEIISISFDFGNEVYDRLYGSELSFDSGATPTSVDYAIPEEPTQISVINWVGVDCASDSYINDNGETVSISIFQPSANTHYDIVFYFNGKQFIGLVNGYVPAGGNEAI